MWYMIPSARRKFDAESIVLQRFSSQRVHQNGNINLYSGSNLRRALWIMYHHVIHDSKPSAQVLCTIQSFARVFVTTDTPKQPYQLLFRLKPALSTLNHVSPCNTWFQALGACLMQNPRFCKGFCHNGYNKTAISTLILAQTCAEHIESCITMWYMIPSARRKFDAESIVSQGFSSQRVHQNGNINLYSGSNLRRALWIMYHHVIHDSKPSAQVWCTIQSFARVFVTTGTPKRPYQLLFWPHLWSTRIVLYQASNVCLWSVSSTL
jgi:hypothetical protein